MDNYQHYSLYFLFNISLGEHHYPAEELPERDAPLGPAARLVQPFRHLVGNSIAQHFMDERLQAQGGSIRTGTSLERFAYTSQLTIRHCK